MKTLAERMKAALDEAGAIPADLARACDVTAASVSNWLSGETKSLKSATAMRAAGFLRVNQAWLTEGRGPMKPGSDANDHLHANVHPGPDIKGCVPLISWVQAGVWNEAIDIYEPGYAEQWLPVLKNGSPHVYALRVQGDSMTAPHGKTYPEGTIIIVDPDLRTPSSGQRVIAKLAGSNAVTFKVYIEEDGRRWLKPLNLQHQPIYDEFRVLGTVTAKYEPE
jgi:SOS-response transcriptional repressor LexA